MNFSLKLNFSKWREWIFVRSIYYVVTVGVLIALFVIGWYTYEKFEQMNRLRRQLEDFEQLVEEVAYEEGIIKRYHQFLAPTNPLYLAHLSQKTTPLASELEVLSNVAQFSAFKGFYPVQQRIKKLKAGKGAINLKTLNRATFETFCLSEHQLVEPLFMNESDIQFLLGAIENVAFDDASHPVGRPDLFFKEFHLVKKRDESNREGYLVNFSLLRRDKS